MTGNVEYFIPMANTCPKGDSHHQLEGMFKKVRPARPRIVGEVSGPLRCLTRGAYGVREHGKMARTPLAAFFNIP